MISLLLLVSKNLSLSLRCDARDPLPSLSLEQKQIELAESLAAGQVFEQCCSTMLRNNHFIVGGII